jgi:class 3 adenylate cyclase
VVQNWGGASSDVELRSPSIRDDERTRAWMSTYMRLGASPGAALTLLRMNYQIDVRDILSAVRVPTLILHRVGDGRVGVENGRYLAERMPAAKYVELPGADHSFATGDANNIADEVEEFVTGERHSAEPDRVLATILFTDIVGSTERAAELGDQRWRALLEDHDRLVRAQLDRSRGRAVKHTGDGFLATFDGPARAARCAVAITHAVRSLGLEVRAGVHTGEVELMGDDLGGIAVHTGARVAAEAGPGEVLVSSTVRDLVAGSGIAFEDRGVHALKGVPGEWRLFAVASV